VARERGEETHRDRFDIIADVLKAALNGTKKTHIMYDCNLSFRQLEGYVRFLVRKGFLSVRVERGSREVRVFEVTDKGEAFLRAYKNLKLLLTV
jgi:predicted transcriptional regulator